MRFRIVLLPMLLAAAFPVRAQPAADPPQLCDFAGHPQDGLEVQARGTLFIDQHGTLFSDIDRRCTVHAGGKNGHVWDRLYDFPITRPARIDATVRGRLVWHPESPGMQPGPGFWLFELSSIADVVVTQRSFEEESADLDSFPNTIWPRPKGS